MALSHPSWTVDTTFSGKNITSAASVYQFTAAADAKVQFTVKLTNAAGNGDYIVYLTHQWLGTGTAAVVLPKTTATAGSDETVIEFVSQEIAVKATDVVNVMIDGLAGDSSVSGAIRISADNPSVFDQANDVPAVNVTMWNSGALPQVAEKSDVSSLSAIQNDTSELSSMTELIGESTYRFKTSAFRNIIGADGDTLESLSDQLDAINPLTAQQTRDAMALAPTLDPNTSYVPAIGSIDRMLLGIMMADNADWEQSNVGAGVLTQLYDDNAIDETTGAATTHDAGTVTSFGAWEMREFNGSLFVGVGHTPQGGIAQIVARVDPDLSAHFEVALPEEGPGYMAVNDDETYLVVVGNDRREAFASRVYFRDSAGNWTTSSLLEDMSLHCFTALWVDDRLWVGGAHSDASGSNVAYTDDLGATWNYVTPVVAATVRIAAMVERNDAIYVAGGVNGPNDFVYKTTDNGATWTEIISLDSNALVRVSLVKLADNTIVVSSAQQYAMYSISTSDVVTVQATPRQFTTAFVHDSKLYCFPRSTTSEVWMTPNKWAWTNVFTYFDADGGALNITPWGDNLVVSTRGADADLLIRPLKDGASRMALMRAAIGMAEADLNAQLIGLKASSDDALSVSEDIFGRIGENGVNLTSLGDVRLANLDAAISSLATAAALAAVESKVDLKAEPGDPMTIARRP